MTANDKTGQKLVDSMRKTKAAAADRAGAAKFGAAASPQKSVRPQAKKKAAARRSPNASRKRGGDPYQSGRRIWPD
jgi:hypothetical protein